MEFQNEVLPVPRDLQDHVRSLLTPGSGSSRMLQTLLEELADFVDRTRPPRWLLLDASSDSDLIVHIATPVFTAEAHDVDEYFELLEDELVYMSADGIATLRDGVREYEIDTPDAQEIGAWQCASHDLLAEFEWYDGAPNLEVFCLMLEDAEQAYCGGLDRYRR